LDYPKPKNSNGLVRLRIPCLKKKLFFVAKYLTRVFFCFTFVSYQSTAGSHCLNNSTTKMLVLQTKTQTLNVAINQDGTLSLTDHKGRPAKGAGSIIQNLGGKDAVLARCKEVQGGAAALKAEKDAQQAENKAKTMARLARLEDLAKVANPTNAELAVMLELISELSSRGWAVSSYLTTGPLSEAIVKQIGDFTATPYSNGSIVVKSAAGILSNNRLTRNRVGDLVDILG
jgi:hypothetical protein